MRITNQMLANSAAKSGISLQRTSLLNILNHKSSSGLLGSIKRYRNYTGEGWKSNCERENFTECGCRCSKESIGK